METCRNTVWRYRLVGLPCLCQPLPKGKPTSTLPTGLALMGRRNVYRLYKSIRPAGGLVRETRRADMEWLTRRLLRDSPAVTVCFITSLLRAEAALRSFSPNSRHLCGEGRHYLLPMREGQSQPLCLRGYHFALKCSPNCYLLTCRCYRLTAEQGPNPAWPSSRGPTLGSDPQQCSSELDLKIFHEPLTSIPSCFGFETVLPLLEGPDSSQHPCCEISRPAIDLSRS